jgi:hypothetical protein
LVIQANLIFKEEAQTITGNISSRIIDFKNGFYCSTTTICFVRLENK